MTVSASRVSKHYGQVTALHDVDLSIADGEVVAIAGENGSGKSTLLKILAGLVAPDTGVFSIDGDRVALSGPVDATRRGISLVSQELALFDDLRVYENVAAPLLPNRWCRSADKRTMIRRTCEVFARIGIDDIDPLDSLRTLSTTQRSRVQLARALVTEPRLLILDEATSRLGASEVDVVFAAVRRLQRTGVATIIVTHRISEMAEMADRVVVLRDGRHVGSLTAAELTEERLVRLMVGRDLTPGTPRVPGADAPVVLQLREVVVSGAPAPVDLEVRAGETVGLAGLMGAGRTELLETIAGVRRPISGHREVDGRPVGSGIGAARRARIGLVPEDRHAQGLVLSASVHENHTMGAARWHHWIRHRSGHAVTDTTLRTFGVKMPGIHAPMTALSGGNQQKVVLARVLSHDPRVLLLDEPTRGVDVGAREDIYRLIAAQAEHGMGVVVASSEIAELLAVCDRVLVMREQRIVGELTGSELTEDNIGRLSAGIEEKIR